MTDSQFEETILWAAIEDYAALYEVIWEFGHEIPPIPFDKIQAAVLSFFHQGYIELFRCKEPYGDVTKIDDGCIDILSDKRNWEIPELSAIGIKISATESGEKYYKSLTGETF